MNVVKTILADDQRIFVEGLKSILSAKNAPRFDIVGTASNSEELLWMLRKTQADLLILDADLPGRAEQRLLNAPRKAPFSIPTLVLSRQSDPRLLQLVIHADVNGLIRKDKSVDELFSAIAHVLAGKTFIGQGLQFQTGRQPDDDRSFALSAGAGVEERLARKHNLTKRELEILRLITGALSNKEIARELFISDQTVSVHRKNIMRKLGVSNTAALVKTAFEKSLV